MIYALAIGVVMGILYAIREHLAHIRMSVGASAVSSTPPRR